MQKEKNGEPAQQYLGRSKISPLLKQSISALLGMVSFYVQWALTPRPVPRSVLQPNPAVTGPALMVWLFRIAELIHSPYVVMPAFIVFLILAICRAGRKNSWIYAFLVGYSFPWIFFHWLLNWI